MSHEAVNWAYGMADRLPASVLPKGPLDVLVTLANFTNQAGMAWCTLATISNRTRYEKKAVIRYLDWCEQNGLVSRMAPKWEIGEDGRPHKAPGEYRLHLDLAQPCRSASQSNGGAIEPPLEAGTPDMTDGSSETPSETNGDYEPPLDGTDSDQLDAHRVQSSKTPSGTNVPPEADVDADGDANGDNGRRLMVAVESPIYGEELEEQEPDQTWPVSDDGGRMVGSGRSLETVQTSLRDDFDLVRSAIPEVWASQLDAAMTSLVAAAVRPLLKAGWTAVDVRAKVGGSPLPVEVHSLGRLLESRVRAIPLDCAPPARQVPSGWSEQVVPESERAVDPPWMETMLEARSRKDPAWDWEHRADTIAQWIKNNPKEVKAWKAAHPGRQLRLPPTVATDGAGGISSEVKVAGRRGGGSRETAEAKEMSA